MASLIAGGVFYLVPKVTSFSEGKGPGSKGISRVTRFHCKNRRYHVCFYVDAIQRKKEKDKNPSSFCQAGAKTTAGDPWLCKLQWNKHELPVNTPSSNTHRLLVLQISPLHGERRQYFFLIVPPQYYWPLLHVCRFLCSLNKKVTGQTISSCSLKNHWVWITCVEVLFIAFTRHSFWAVFKWLSKVIAIATLSDWLKRVAPVF